MNKYLLSLVVFIVSCGSAKSGDSEKEAASINDTTASLVMTAADLPPCDDAAKGKLIYIKETGEFRYCSGSNWAFVNINGKDGKDGKDGADGESGLSFASLKNLKPNSEDICTYYANETCLFSGGSVTRFTDGSVYLVGVLYFFGDYTETGDTNGDSFYVTNSMFCPAGGDVCGIALGSFPRGADPDDRLLSLVYDMDNNTAHIYSDRNEDGELDLVLDEKVFDVELIDSMTITR